MEQMKLLLILVEQGAEEKNLCTDPEEGNIFAETSVK